MTPAIPAGGLPITQVAAVVHDLDAAMKRTTRPSAGARGTSTSTCPRRCTTRTTGAEPVEYSMLGAEVQAGPVVFELLQPLDGPSIYQDWLDEHGEGLHHVAVMRHDAGGVRRAQGALRRARRRAAHGRPHRRDIEFYYLDTRAPAEGDHRVRQRTRDRPASRCGGTRVTRTLASSSRVTRTCRGRVRGEASRAARPATHRDRVFDVDLHRPPPGRARASSSAFREYAGSPER